MSSKSKAASAKCYMCSDTATTREHIPARTFFPTGYRKELWSVPSCLKHNNNNSLDVEYVAGCIVSAIESTGVALEENQKKVFRAFDRRKRLMLGTYQDIRPIRLPSGEMTATFRIDIDRFQSVMEALAYGIYNYTSKSTYKGRWRVVSPNLGTVETKHKGQRDDRAFLFNAFSEMSFDEIATPQPDVFKCSAYTFPDGKVVYRFEFYNGVIVYAIDTFIYEVMTDGRL